MNDKRHAASQDRLKSIIYDATIRNSELQDEIRILEQDRIHNLHREKVNLSNFNIFLSCSIL